MLENALVLETKVGSLDHPEDSAGIEYYHVRHWFGVFCPSIATKFTLLYPINLLDFIDAYRV